MAMSIKHCKQWIPNDTHDDYEVTFFDDTVLPIVTKTPSVVDAWVSRIENKYHHRPHSLVVGLDVEWRPNLFPDNENPVATLQLSVGRRCLIFQLLFSPTMPQSLKNFLRNPYYKFVGVGIGNDVQKLMENWSLKVANTAEIGVLAAQKYGERELRNAGLKELTIRVLGKELMKPKDVTMSNWDNEQLTPAQVQYACIDAFLSHKIGRILISGNRK